MRHIKKLKYKYDLVSGNVKKLTYQKEKQDQLIHRYTYDSDNRITITETSTDGVIFEKDAKYFYYAHGPLARTETGEHKVQAMDYAYTIQGWLKTVNGEALSSTTMMGQDGENGTQNELNAKDIYGYSLTYFENDYLASNMAMLNHSTGNTNMTAELFNGNIRGMFVSLSDEHEHPLSIKTHQTNYTYDQLNRIKGMEGFDVANNQQSGYSSAYSYDANGNLKSLLRRALLNGNSTVMDNFNYKYINENVSNQLEWVDDQGGASVFGNADIDNSQHAGNYSYDAIGQLVSDTDEGISEIKWKVNNKVDEVNYSSNRRIRFRYDAMGHRISKMIDNAGQAGVFDITYYVNDAQGNPISTYRHTSEQDHSDFVESFKLEEQHLYGSSRVGVQQVGTELGNNSFQAPAIHETAISFDNLQQGTACQGIGKWYFADPSGTVFDAGNYDTDGSTDLNVHRNGTAAGNFAAQLTLKLIPGKSYALSFELIQNNTDNLTIQGLNCNPYEQFFTEVLTGTGPRQYSFIAPEGDGTIRLKWFSSNPSHPSPNFILGKLKVTGPGDVLGTASTAFTYTSENKGNQAGDKMYELVNHLGNVLNTVSDRKLPIDIATYSSQGTLINNNPDGIIDGYSADVVSYSDYYPGGQLLPGRHSNETEYRYGAANGQEKVDEISGSGNHYTAEYWEYDSRLIRRWNTDPVVKPHESPYACYANNPVMYVDKNGADTSNFAKATKDAGFKSAASDLFKGSPTFKAFIDKFAKTEGAYHDIKVEFRAVKNLEDAGGNSAAGTTYLMYKNKWIYDLKDLPENASLADFSILIQLNASSSFIGDELRADKTNTLVHEILIHLVTEAGFLSESIVKDANGKLTVKGKELLSKHNAYYKKDTDHTNLYSGDNKKIALYMNSYKEILNYFQSNRKTTPIIPNDPSLVPNRKRNPTLKGPLLYWELLEQIFVNDMTPMPAFK